MGKTLKTWADYRLRQNMVEYSYYYREFERLLLTMFTWDNLPDGISQRFIEQTLINTGLCIFYKSKKLGCYMVSKVAKIGYNDYNEPTKFKVIHNGQGKFLGKSETIERKECVPIYNDITMNGETLRIDFHSKKISRIEKTITQNLLQLSNPYMVSCPEEQLESVKKVFKEKEENVPYIVTSKAFDDNVKINVFDLHTTNNLESLEKERIQVKNDFLTSIGINNVNIMKKERLITGESNANNEEINYNKITRMKTRLLAIEEINEKFNQNIKLELSQEFYKEFLGGGENVGNYNNNLSANEK